MGKYLTFVLFFVISFTVCKLPAFAQTMRTGPDGYVRCGTQDYIRYLEKSDTLFVAKLAAAEHSIRTEENKEAALHRNTRTDKTIYTLPLVIHILWSDSAERLPLWQVESQINVLNRDYNRLNSDTVNTPSVFKQVAASMNIIFCLAQRDPNGNPTTGVVYKQVPPSTQFTDNDAMKFPSLGGDTAWDVTKYLNVWVCNLAGGLLGYSVFPFLPLNAHFGSVVLYSAFGDTSLPGGLLANYNLGRTTTHEIGHLLDLHHPWADDYGLCPWNNGGSSDSIPDIPPEGNSQSDGYGAGWGPTFGCPPFPYTDNCTSSFPGIMFENYMEYTNDACMNIFSRDQALRAWGTINGPLASLLTSDACTPLSVDNLNISEEVAIYPNPSAGKFNIEWTMINGDWSVEAFDVLSRKICSQYQLKDKSCIVDLSGYPNGVYFIRIINGNSITCKKVVVTR